MGINNSKKFDTFNLVFCFIISIIIFFLFNNISFFNNLLGEVNITGATGDTKPVACNDYFFCRAPITLYLYYFLSYVVYMNISG